MLQSGLFHMGHAAILDQHVVQIFPGKTGDNAIYNQTMEL